VDWNKIKNFFVPNGRSVIAFAVMIGFIYFSGSTMIYYACPGGGCEVRNFGILLQFTLPFLPLAYLCACVASRKWILLPLMFILAYGVMYLVGMANLIT
jgi:hypothetical protein